MSLLTAKPPGVRTTALAMVVLFCAVGASAEPPAPTPTPALDASPLQIRCRDRYVGNDFFRFHAEKFRKSHPEIAVSYEKFDGPCLELAKQLAAGRLEIAMLVGPGFRLSRDVDPANGARHDLLLDLLVKSGCEYAVIGRSAMAVVVHPQNPLQEIDQVQAEQLLSCKLHSGPWIGGDPPKIELWKAFGQEDRPIRIMIDRRVDHIIRQCIGLEMVRWHDAPKEQGPEQVAGDRWGMGFGFLDKRLAASGLKILPVRPTGGKKAVLPSPENVLSGKYPFFGYLLLASRPGASPLVREFRKTLENFKAAGTFGLEYQWLWKLDYTLPGEAREELWPPPDGKAAAPVVAGAVAVLPLEPLSAEFLMAGPSHHALYEQAVADAIAKDARLSMVDRTELARVLKEYKLKLASGVSPPQRAIITADVLVLPCVATMDSRTYLSVEAVHAATTSCLGRMKLPIDPARPENLVASIGPKTAQWWPGVLRNLAAAQHRPVWTLLRPPCQTTNLN